MEVPPKKLSKKKNNYHTYDKIEHAGKNSEFEFSEDVENHHGFDKYEDTSGLEDEVGINPSILQIECNHLQIINVSLKGVRLSWFKHSVSCSRGM